MSSVSHIAPFRLKFLLAVVSLAGILLSSCSSSKTSEARTMTEVMADVRKKMNSPRNNYNAERKIAFIDSIGSTLTDENQRLNMALQKAAALIEYGNEVKAVELYEQIFNAVKADPESRHRLLLTMGMAYMRLAERSNCVDNNMSESCIIPIKGGGIHKDKIPARKATQMFEELLKIEPQNLDALWLLNIAYMTLGEYPDGVPAAWRIPNLDNPGNVRVKPFTNIASDLGLAINDRSGGVAVDDFNNDGYLDVVLSAWGLDDPMHLFLSNGDGTFKDASASSGLSQIFGGLSLTQTDYNNDGNLDIFVFRGAWQGQAGFGEQPNSLLRNNGNGTFTDVTIEAGLLSFHPTQAGTWNDFNNDGWLDLFIGNETTDANDLHPCEFYINNQDGTFTNIASSDEFNVVAFIKGVVSGDYDNDGWSDIFISSLNGQKVLLHNKGVSGTKPVFEEVSAQAGFVNPAAGVTQTFPTGFFDYDNDGWLDLFMCNYEFSRPLSFYAAKEALNPSDDWAGKLYIYHNNKNGTFTDVSKSMHLNTIVFAMGANFGDIDNDGYLDLYMGTGNPNFQSLVPNKMFKNINGTDFVDVTVSARVGNLQKGHGVAFADFNNNGDQDIYIEMGGAFRGDAYPSALYLNPGQNLDNNWICIKLEGDKSNRAAIGAKVTLKFRENGKERMVYREVNSGASYGCSPLRREIGIGRATVIDEIVINWPATGITQVLKNVKPNQFIKVKEGVDGFQPAGIKTMIFKRKDGSIPMCAPVK